MSTADVDVSLDDLDEDEFMDVVKDDIFQHGPGGWKDDLRHPDHLDRFHAVLKLLTTDLHNQLAVYKESLEIGARVPDDDWRRRTVRLKRAAEVRLVEVKALVKANNIRLAAERKGDGSTRLSLTQERLFTQLRRMRWAIHNHRDQSEAEDYEPTEFDVALWAILEEEEATNG